MPHFQRETCFKIQLAGWLEGSFSHLDPTAYFQPLHRGPPGGPPEVLRDSSALRARNRGFAPLVFGDLRFRRGGFRQDTPLSIAWVMACELIASNIIIFYIYNIYNIYIFTYVYIWVYIYIHT